MPVSFNRNFTFDLLKIFFSFSLPFGRDCYIYLGDCIYSYNKPYRNILSWIPACLLINHFRSKNLIVLFDSTIELTTEEDIYILFILIRN